MQNPKILICEEAETIRETLKLTLGDLYNLVMVETAEMAEEVLKHSKDIQIIITNNPLISPKKTSKINILPIKKPFKASEILEEIKKY